MGSYLFRLQDSIRQKGLHCPMLLMMSGGGLTTLELAARFPIRLVESGPAGGAILAAHLARECGLDKVLAFDMGGTTAKICLINNGQPERSRRFEIGRVWKNLKGSGLPIRIPVIELVEIGAGGGSIGRVDALQRITVGPDSCGSEPGPACYGRGGELPAVTDANVVLGRIDPEWVMLQREAPLETMAAALGRRIILNPAPAGPIHAEILAQTEIIVPNEVEAAQLTGQPVDGPDSALRACAALLSMGPQAAVVTMGRLGCVWKSPIGEGWIAPPNTRAVDTKAAGDCFAGALAAGLARGEDLPQALRLAVAASSLSVERPGAMESMPTLAEAEAKRPLTQEKSLFS
jgi:hypothetical protein